jgi:hypothetical protein
LTLTTRLARLERQLPADRDDTCRCRPQAVAAIVDPGDPPLERVRCDLCGGWCAVVVIEEVVVEN